MELEPLAILRAVGIGGDASVVRVSGVWDTALWRVEHPGGAYALRVFRPEQVETCRREVAAMRAAAGAGLPIPAVHGETTWRGHPALLLSWCEGRPLLGELDARPGRAWALGVEFGRVQARIHAVRPPAGLRGLDEVWSRWLGPDEAALLERVRALARRAPALLHLDYHPLNVLASGRRVTGVLDWANAAAGDPRLDVARTATILRLAPAPPGGSLRPSRPVRRAFARGWRRGYEQAVGPPDDLPVFYAAAGAIMERDLAPKVGRPGIWLEPCDIDRIRRWTGAWKARLALAL